MCWFDSLAWLYACLHIIFIFSLTEWVFWMFCWIKIHLFGVSHHCYYSSSVTSIKHLHVLWICLWLFKAKPSDNRFEWLIDNLLLICPFDKKFQCWNWKDSTSSDAWISFHWIVNLPSQKKNNRRASNKSFGIYSTIVHGRTNRWQKQFMTLNEAILKRRFWITIWDSFET